MEAIKSRKQTGKKTAGKKITGKATGVKKKTKKSAAKKKVAGRVAIGMKRWASMMAALSKACGGGDVPLYLELLDDGTLRLRAVNEKTGQRVLSVLKGASVGGVWVEADEWEKGLCNGGGKKKKPLLKKKKLLKKRK